MNSIYSGPHHFLISSYSKVGALHALKFMRASLGFFSHGAAITCGGLDPDDDRLDTCEEFDPKNNR